jgi:hypothetical protein
VQTYGFTRSSASTEYGILVMHGLLSALIDLPILGRSTVYGYSLSRRLIDSEVNYITDRYGLGSKDRSYYLLRGTVRSRATARYRSWC